MIAFIVIKPLKCSVINKMDLKIDFDKNKCVECVDKKGKSFKILKQIPNKFCGIVKFRRHPPN